MDKIEGGLIEKPLGNSGTINLSIVIIWLYVRGLICSLIAYWCDLFNSISLFVLLMLLKILECIIYHTIIIN